MQPTDPNPPTTAPFRLLHQLGAPAPQLSALQNDLMRKADLESGMIAAPHDTKLRWSYFEEIVRFASVRSGLSYALLPELGHPIILRCGTADVIALARVFRDRAYDFPMRATPARILILGAYVGYSAVFLAHRFPEARIVCVEPCTASFRQLSLNTIPFQKIQALNIAVWHSATRLGVQNRILGDWGLQLHDQLPDAERNMNARSLSDILRAIGWDQVDLIVSDIIGAETTIVADARQRWMHTLDTFAVVVPEVGAAAFAEQAERCFDPEAYAHSRHGEFHLIERQIPFRSIPRPTPRDMPFISCEPGHFPVGLQDAPLTGWGFFVFDGESCQLHPNPPGDPPSRAVFPRTLDGHSRFTATARHAGRPAAPIAFSLIVAREDGSEVSRETWTVASGERQDINLDLPPLHGRHHLILQCEMIAGAPHNYNAWSQWLSPRIA